jgi:formylglycine-generating enzyme required for sulfatase activity
MVSPDPRRKLAADHPGAREAGMADEDQGGGLPAGFLVRGRFRIDAQLASSASSIVYKAFDLEMERWVALKEYFPRHYVTRRTTGAEPTVAPLSDEHLAAFLVGIKNFRDEAKALAHVRHPNIVTVYDRIDEAHGTAYLVMELVEGPSLRALIAQNGRLRDEGAVRAILEPMMAALESVHRLGLIHRDVKPGNIILRSHDNQPVLLDFGIARAANALRFTVHLTPGYAPAEQYAETSRQGPYSDIYGLAAVAYYLVTGKTPVDANSRFLALYRKHPDPMPRITELVPDQPFPFSSELVAAIEAGLATDYEQRPQTIADWRLRFERGRHNGEVLRRRWPDPGCIFRDRAKDGTANALFPEMVILPAGRFLMGSPAGEEEREGIPEVLRGKAAPQHEVTLAGAVAIGRYPVTRGQFREFLAHCPGYTIDDGAWAFTGGSWEKRKGSWQAPGFDQTDDHPVVCVNWTDAQAYVRWLSAITGETYRLPSEAEWEYACRADTTTARFWGNTIEPMVRYAQCYNESTRDAFPGPKSPMIAPGRTRYRYTAPVGSFSPNGFDLHDMLGNVWEWCEDTWTRDYRTAPTDGSPVTAADNPDRVLRGGSWLNLPTYVRSAYRGHAAPHLRFLNFGFRVARELT